MNRPRLLIADDHTLVVEGFRKLLEPAFELAGVAEDGRAMVAKALDLRPDVVLADIAMPILNGIEAARQLHRAAPDIKIVFVTMHSDPAYVAAALDAGAAGYLLKRSAASELTVALAEVLAGRTYITSLIPADKIEALLRASRSGRPFEQDLTSRQREVLQLVAEGRTSKEIAAILHISVKTVEFHKAGIMERLGLRTTAELTRYALEHGIVGA